MGAVRIQDNLIIRAIFVDIIQYKIRVFYVPWYAFLDGMATSAPTSRCS